MATAYCPICGGIEWIEELENDIIDPHTDCLEEYLRIEIERKERMKKREAIEKKIEDDLINEVVFNGGKTIP